MPNKPGVLYIPRMIRLPGPFNVRVNQLKAAQMKATHGEYYDAIWDINSMSVDILRTLDHRRKWFVYSHEYAHVVNDWLLWLVNEGISKG